MTYKHLLRRLVFAYRILFKSKRYDYTPNCPYCNLIDINLKQRKYWFLQFRECKHCGLMFRYPKDSTFFSIDFYNDFYKQEEDLTTELPTIQELEKLKADNFVGSTKDFSERIEMLKRLIVHKDKLLEFGSSWGYFLYQAKKSGFDCYGIEISKKRAIYGVENLHVEIYTDYESILDNSIDVIYSCHVLEHISNLPSVFNFFVRVLKRNGLLIIECPNCSSDEAKKLGVYWGPMIGEVHVNALTPNFLSNALISYGFKVRMTTNMDEVNEREQLFSIPQKLYSLNGTNLIVLAHRNL